MNVPKSPSTVSKMVFDYEEKIRKQLTEEIALCKSSGMRFSLTLDEWMSKRNRRYMNINVHGDTKFWNIGLAKAYGKMPAETCLEILQTKLTTFDLCSDDFVGITTDGESVMRKFGSYLSVIHQLCLAHGMELAVLKILYRKETIPYTDQSDEENSSSDDEQIGSIEDDGMEIINDAPFQNYKLIDPNFNTLIDKVRKVVKRFRRSRTKNDSVFQKHCVEKFGTEKSLILDLKTR